MNTLEVLREDIISEFIGNEKQFEGNIIENIDQIVECLKLPKIKAVGRQKQIRFKGGQIIMDIVVRHVDDSATIFEVKKQNAKNKQVSPHAQMQAIGQLLLYQNVFEAKTNINPRLVLIDNKIHERTYLAFMGNNLPITLVDFQKDRIFIPYRYY